MSGEVAVKLCGLRTVADLDAAIDAGALLAGVVMTSSRRQIDPEQARAIVERAHASGAEVAVVGVFTDESRVVIADRVARSGVDMVQLSGRFDAENVELVRQMTDRPVIAVVHVDDGLPLETLREAVDVADIVLLDAARGSELGGTGNSFDHTLLDQIGDLIHDIGIAGGLDATVVGAVARRRPRLVDVSSGIERDGAKDPQMMREFVAAVREARPEEARS